MSDHHITPIPGLVVPPTRDLSSSVSGGALSPAKMSHGVPRVVSATSMKESELVDYHHYEIMSSASSRYFAERLAELLELSTRRIIRSTFQDGEEYYRICLDGRDDLIGKDVVYVSSTANDVDFLELVRVGMTLASLGTRRRVFVIPFLGYSTMERAVRPGEIVSMKHNARILSAIPNSGYGNFFLYLDLHVQGIIHYFEGPAIHMELYAEKLLVDSVRGILRKDNIKDNEFLFASADMGRPLWVDTFARIFGTDVALIRKRRQHDTTTVEGVVGDVRGKHVFIYDDMTRTGGTLINAAEAYIQRGALSVYAVLSHLALANVGVITKMAKSDIRHIISTNSHPMSQHPDVKNSEKYTIVDVSPLFAQGIFDYFTRRR